MRSRFWTALALLAAAWAAGCTNSPTEPGSTQNTSRIVVSPGSLSFSQLGASSGVRVSFQGAPTQPPDSFWHFTSSNPAVATVSGDSSPNRTVTAMANGSATIHITLDTVTDTADVPVTVNAAAPALNAYNGLWKGDVNLKSSTLRSLAFTPQSCAGSLNSYGESLTINVNASGAGTATVTDTPGFDRAYQVTIPSSLSFTGGGTFPFFGAPIPGQLSVTISNLTQLTFQETTTYGSCSNTYGGQLTKQ